MVKSDGWWVQFIFHGLKPRDCVCQLCKTYSLHDGRNREKTYKLSTENLGDIFKELKKNVFIYFIFLYSDIIKSFGEIY